MNIMKQLFFGVFLSSLIFLTGCQSNNSDGTGDVNKTAPVIDTNNTQEVKYLALENSTITVTRSGETQDIAVRALTSNYTLSTTGNIQVQYPDQYLQDGTFTPNIVSISNGIAHFTYTAPSDLQARVTAGVTSQNFTFFSETDGTVTTTLHVNFSPSSTTQSIPVIQLPTSNIIVTKDAETVSVQVLAFDDNNQSLNTGTVAVTYPSEIINDNANGGRFQENEVNIVNGVATFTFIGPSNLEDISPLNFTFSYKGNDSVVKRTLTVNYSPPVANVILTSTSKEVKLNSEVVNIDVRVIDESNNPYPDGNVKIVYPDDVKSGRDVGSFASSTVPLTNGIASFTYTAPKKLDDNKSDIVFKFYHDSVPTVLKTFTIKINPDPNQIVLTDYNLSVNYADNNISMKLESNKLMAFTLQNDTGELVTDGNITSMTIEMLNQALGTLEDTSGNSATTLTVNNKNSVSVNLKSNTISGVVPLRVTVNFTDANGNPRSITDIFNVVVLSGPPTAMSISYVSTSQDDTNAKFVEKMLVALTDKYSNRVDSAPGISAEVIAGYASDTSGPANYMYHSNGASVVSGTLNKITTTQGSVQKVVLSSTGLGYALAPSVSLAGGDGNFKATAVLSSSGSITNITMSNNGSGYTVAPTVSITGAGSGFVGEAVLSSTGSFLSISLDNPGNGYTSKPTVTAAGVVGSGFSAEAVLESTGYLKTYSIINGGSGYAVGDTLPVGGDGTSAAVKVSKVSTSGAITGLKITNAGSGYSNASIDTLIAGNKDADINVTIGYKLKEIRLLDGGSGYSTGDLTISGGNPDSNAVASGTLAYSVDHIHITSGGSGYTYPTVSIDSTNGYGQDAYGVASVKYPISYVTIESAGSGYSDGNVVFTNQPGDTGSGASAQAYVFKGFTNIDENNQYLVTFGNGYTYDASGKWDITKTNAANNYELVLKDDFNGNTTSNMGFAIGNNHRQDKCLDAKEWVAVASVANGGTFDSNGLAEVDISYDYYLTGKDIMLAVNLVGAQNSLGQTIKLGEATKHTLRGNGLETGTINVPAGVLYGTTDYFQIYQTNTVEPLRNSHFNYSVKASDGITIHYVESKESDLNDCSLGDGREWVKVTYSSTKAGTITLENLIIQNEF